MKPFSGKTQITIPPHHCKGKTCINYDACPRDSAVLCDLVQQVETYKKNNNSQSDLSIIENQRYSNIVLFPQDDRPTDAKLPDVIKNAKEIRFMARTGINFLREHSEVIKQAIANGCKCKFIVVNKDSQVIEYGQFKPHFDKRNAPTSYEYLEDIKKKGQDKVEIHVLNHFPPFSFEYYEKSDRKKIIIIRPHFLTNFSPSTRPMFMLNEGDFWYDYFYNEFDNLWGKSQVLGKTRKWGDPKRIVIDGPPGAGKTTLLVGKSDRDDMGHREFVGSFDESGYAVFGGMVNYSIKKMREKSKNPNMQPADDWELFFKFAVDLAIKFHKEAKENLISFYDRGILFLEFFAKEGNYQGQLPKKYYDFVNDPKNRYDEPIFMFRPIPGYEVTPHMGDADIRNYTFEQQERVYSEILAVYKKYKYKVIEIDAPTDPNIIQSHNDVQKNINERLEIIKKELKI